MNLSALTIEQAKIGLSSHDFSVVELVKDCFDSIKKRNPKLNAYLTLNEEEALRQAIIIDKRYDDKRYGEKNLLGIPLCIKDNFCTKGLRTTASSKVLDNFIPPYDATVVKKLKDAGAIILGKTNLDSFAHGSSTETSDYGPTKNPWNLKHLPGGSSGGSAAAVSADLCVTGIGSETAGSIRQPASWCGVVGLKPTYGRVSRYGLISMVSSTDSPGPLTKTVSDSAYLLNILAGFDPSDATTSSNKISDYTTELKTKIKLTIGIPRDYFPKDMNIEVKNKVWEAIKLLEKLGHTIKEIDLLDPQYSISDYTILQRSEVSSNLARFDGIRYGNKRDKFNAEGKRRIMLGTYALSAGFYDAFYLKAQKVRTIICDNFKKAFSKFDFLIGPTSPVTALPLGATKDSIMFGELQDILLEPSSLAGLPGISLPCGFSKDGLPIGMQIIGPQFSEEKILSLAYQYEQETEWHKIKPKI